MTVPSASTQCCFGAPDEWAVIDLEGPEIDDMDGTGTDARVDLHGRRLHTGDQVSARRLYGAYRHHGVLLDADHVLHVNAGPFSGVAVCLGLRPAVVRVDTRERFLKQDRALLLEFRNSADASSAARNREALRQHAGQEVPYNLLFRNCEHFASEAAGVVGHSPQLVRGSLLTLLSSPMLWMIHPVVAGVWVASVAAIMYNQDALTLQGAMRCLGDR